MEGKFEHEAGIIAAAIEKLANNPEALIGFESYLAHHFDKWIAKWAHDPEGMAAEFEYFAGLYD